MKPLLVFVVLALVVSQQQQQRQSLIFTDAAASGSSIVAAKSNNVKIASGVSSVLAELDSSSSEDGAGNNKVTTACYVTSRGVPRKLKLNLAKTLLGGGGDDEDDDILTKNRVVASSKSKLVLAMPLDGEPSSSAAVACGGLVVYYPDKVDIQRREGLFDALAPLLEKLLKSPALTKSQCTLFVVVDSPSDVQMVKSNLEQAAEPFLTQLVANGDKQQVKVLQDVFERVQYVTPEQALAELKSSSCVASFEDAAIAADAAGTVALSSSSADTAAAASPSKMMSAPDLAAARTMGPQARELLASAVGQVREVCQQGAGGDESTVGFVAEFGELCDAAIGRALQELDQVTADAPAVSRSRFGQQIRSNLASDLDSALFDLFEDQLGLLLLRSFDECKGKMSKLLISPNLGSDMAAVASESVKDFARNAKKLVARKSLSWSTSAAVAEYRATLKEFCTSRLQAAQAGGQFRPLPRKGVTVGMHWLLPKPFGNDYRQEPWMVHASDNLVYVPPDKISDVSPEEVAAGDWRSKIVPSPAGNDMLYMQ